MDSALTLSEVLAAAGIEHKADRNTANTGKRVLSRDGQVIGRYTAFEAWEHLEEITAPK